MLMFPSEKKSGGVTISSLSARAYKTSSGSVPDRNSFSVPVVNDGYSTVSVGTVSRTSYGSNLSATIRFRNSSSSTISTVTPDSNNVYTIPNGTATIEISGSAEAYTANLEAKITIQNIVIS